MKIPLSIANLQNAEGHFSRELQNRDGWAKGPMSHVKSDQQLEVEPPPVKTERALGPLSNCQMLKPPCQNTKQQPRPGPYYPPLYSTCRRDSNCASSIDFYGVLYAVQDFIVHVQTLNKILCIQAHGHATGTAYSTISCCRLAPAVRLTEIVRFDVDQHGQHSASLRLETSSGSACGRQYLQRHGTSRPRAQLASCR